jgi:hypothetical protein
MTLRVVFQAIAVALLLMLLLTQGT